MTPLYQCPKCKGTNLRVIVTAIAEVFQDHPDDLQTDIEGDAEWGDDSIMYCYNRDCQYEGPSRNFYTGDHVDDAPEYQCGDPRNGAPEMQGNTPSVSVNWGSLPVDSPPILPAQGPNGRLFTPRISMESSVRQPMQLSDADFAKISRGRPWQAFVTDQTTGKRYQVIGAECEAGPTCFCDAVIACRMTEGNL